MRGHAFLAAVNDELRARQIATSFVCECGQEGCSHVIDVPVDVFDTLRTASLPLLAPGHLVERARRTRERAVELQEESRAVRAQAHLSQQRALDSLEEAARLRGVSSLDESLEQLVEAVADLRAVHEVPLEVILARVMIAAMEVE